MSAFRAILAAQREWAARSGHPLVSRNHLAALESNLFQPMPPGTAKEFDEGSGSELRPRRNGQPPKMLALCSSSILACNAFDYWRQHGPGLPGMALGTPSPVVAMRFEGKCPTGLGGTPPNLDVLLTLQSGEVWGVESKFCEPFSRRKGGPSLPDAYFPKGTPLWSERGPPRCGELAAEMRRGQSQFAHLDAVQLLKHILGLARGHAGRFTLCYLYFDVPGPEGDLHREELARFTVHVEPEVPFISLSYQGLVGGLRALAGPYHDQYFRYMEERYGLAGVPNMSY